MIAFVATVVAWTTKLTCAGLHAAVGERALDGLHEALRRIRGRRQHLRDRDTARLLVDQRRVRERAADVDRQPDAHVRSAFVVFVSTRRSAIATL